MPTAMVYTHIMGDDNIGSDDRVVADVDALQNSHFCSDPYIVADGNGVVLNPRAAIGCSSRPTT